MTFLSPWFLLILVPVAALALGYVLVQRRRQRYAVRFASLPMLERVAPRRPGWRRHLPAALMLLALAALGVGAARPELSLRVPYDRATVMVAIDTSGSMAASDVAPTRLDAAKTAASAFVDDLPGTVNVGLVSFAGSANVLAPPTTDHAQVQRQIAALNLAGGGTAVGEAVFSSVGQVQQMIEQADGAEAAPARIVLLSDGDNTSGRSPQLATQAAEQAAVPIFTIAYGTQNGTMPGSGQRASIDPQALQQMADQTGGRSYSAASGEQLAEVYDDIGSSIGWRVEEREITPFLAAFGLLIMIGAGALSLRWFSRIV